MEMETIEQWKELQYSEAMQITIKIKMMDTQIWFWICVQYIENIVYIVLYMRV